MPVFRTNHLRMRSRPWKRLVPSSSSQGRTVLRRVSLPSLRQVRNLESETEAEAMEEDCLLTVLSYTGQSHVPTVAPRTVSQENAPQICTGQYDGGIFSIVVPSSQINCVNLTRKKNKTRTGPLWIFLHRCRHASWWSLCRYCGGYHVVGSLWMQHPSLVQRTCHSACQDFRIYLLPTFSSVIFPECWG